MHTKKHLLIIICGILVFAMFPIVALSDEDSNDDNTNIDKQERGKFSTKDEVIYGKLDHTGKIKNMYVVNSFHVTTLGELMDYGDYTNIRNLTDLTHIKQSGNNKIHFQADETEFYYQGELHDKPLPWDFSIDYLLDGKKTNPAELAGKSGHLEIQIKTSANNVVDQVFFENYLVQISLTLDPLIFHNIHAPKGIEANEGKNKLVTFSVMPEQEDILIVSADVSNLKMDPIDISAIPANIALEDPNMDEMTKEMNTLAHAIRDINTGVGKLSNGISDLNEGTDQLSKGSKEYLRGMNEIDQSSGELIAGSQEILTVLNKVSDALEQSPELPDINIDDIKELPKAFRDIAKRLRELAQTMNNLDEAIDQIPNTNITEKQLKELEKAIKDTGANAKVLDQLIETYNAAKNIQANAENIPKEIKNLLNEMASNLDTIATEIESNMKDIEKLTELGDLQTGIATLATEYETFHNGLVSYTNGFNTLTTSYKEIDQGIADTSKGTSAINRGIAELHDGTKKLHKETSNLSGQMQSEVDKLLEGYDFSDFEPTSFVSEKNENIGVVQFVLRTETIELEDSKEPTDEQQEKKSIWERFLDLFR